MSSTGNIPSPGAPPVADGVRSEPPQIPNHKLLRCIGRGGFGEVWLAVDALSKWTAVKVVYAGSCDHTRGFEQEFRGLKNYDELANTDGSLMPIRNIGRDEQKGIFYYSMEIADDARTRAPLKRIIDGDPTDLASLSAAYEPWTLSTELRHFRRLPPRECARHATFLAEAIEKLHAGKVLHRDIKPSNIIFVHGRPKLADIGLAAVADASRTSLVGTPGFVPFHEPGTISGDVFALGKVIYLMASGRRIEEFPQDAGDLDDWHSAERQDMAELRAIFDRACDPDANRRYASASDLRKDLELFLGNESVLRLRRLEVLARRWKIGLTIGLPLIAALIGGFVFTGWRNDSAHRAALGELSSRKLSRMQIRRQGWSIEDWNRSREAAQRSIDVPVLRQAVATLSGLDARLVHQWRKLEATSAAFSQDGRILLSGARDSAASLILDLTNRIELPVIGEGKAGWDLNGEAVILLVETNGFVVREAQSGRVRHIFPWPAGEHGVSAAPPVVALSADCRFGAGLLVGGESNKVVVWRAEDSALLGRFASDASSLAFAPDGSRLAVGRPDGSIAVFRLDSSQLEALLPVPVGRSPVLALAFGKDLKVPLEGKGDEPRWLLAAGHRGTGIVIWELTNRLPRSFCHGSTWDVESVAFHPDGVSLASAGRMGVRFWDVATGRQLLLTVENGSNTRALAFNSDGSLLVSGSTAESSPADVCVWEVQQHRGIQRLRGLTSSIRKVSFSPDGRRVAALSDEWLLAIWDVSSGRLLRLFEVPAGRYADSAAITFSRDGELLAFSTATEASLINLGSGKRMATWPLPIEAYGDQLQFDDGGQLVLARVVLPSSKDQPRRWKTYRLVSDGQPTLLATQEEKFYSTVNVSLTAGARRLIVFAHDRGQRSDSVRAIDPTSGREEWVHPARTHGGWHLIPVDPTGHLLALVESSEPNTSRLIAVDNGRSGEVVPRCFAVGPGGHRVVGYNSAENYLALISMDRPATELPLETDGELHGDGCAFSVDGTLVALGSTEGVLIIANIAELNRKVLELAPGSRLLPPIATGVFEFSGGKWLGANDLE